MRFEYRQWGKSIYDIFYLYDYNIVSRTFKSTSIGMVEKKGRMWVSMKHPNLAAKTRKELAEILANKFVEDSLQK